MHLSFWFNECPPSINRWYKEVFGTLPHERLHPIIIGKRSFFLNIWVFLALSRTFHDLLVGVRLVVWDYVRLLLGGYGIDVLFQFCSYIYFSKNPQKLTLKKEEGNSWQCPDYNPYPLTTRCRASLKWMKWYFLAPHQLFAAPEMMIVQFVRPTFSLMRLISLML